MKKWILTTLVLGALSAGRAQDCADLQWMYKFLEDNHFTPRVADSVLTDGTARRFFELFDDTGYYLDQPTRERILQASGRIADDVADGTCAFEAYLMEEISSADDRVIALLQSDEFWEFPYDSTRRFQWLGRVAADEAELAENWRRYIQFETLMEYSHRADEPSLVGYRQAFDVLKKQLRTLWECRMRKSTTNEVRKMYFQAFLHGYDPYTEFFDSEDIKAFMSSLSSELHGVGFFLRQDFKGDYIVSEVIKGSSADEMGIQKEDQLLAISRDDTPVDLNCYRDLEINEMLFGESNETITVVVRSAERTDSLRLTKGPLDSEVKAVQPFVLIGERRIGYVSVPSFYFGDELGVGSMSRDLAMALWQLSREGVEGVMIGLQGNGGGSIDEAVEFLSLFLDEGDLFQIQLRDKKPQKVKDPVRGMMYYGPLMILLDGQSASASELVAMVLQEQTRAMVVGDTTFGKTSAQTIVPLGDPNDPEPSQLLKYTTSGWYNLRGKSFNETGLAPDVRVPLLTYRDRRGQPYPSVKSMLGPRQKYIAMPLEQLQQQSDSRLAQTHFLAKRAASFEWFNAMVKSREGMPLTFAHVQQMEAMFKEMDGELSPLDFEIRPVNPSDQDELYISWIKKDLLVVEGFNVFLDWLKATGK